MYVGTDTDETVEICLSFTIFSFYIFSCNDFTTGLYLPLLMVINFVNIFDELHEAWATSNDFYLLAQKFETNEE